MIRSLLALALLGGIFFTTPFAQTIGFQRLPYGIDLEGDTIAFDKSTNSVQASGNVVLSYNHYVLQTESLKYSSDTGAFDLQNPLTLKIQDQVIHAAHLSYNLKTYQGHSGGMHTHVAGMVIRGEHIQFGKDKIIVYNAYFTSCDRDKPNHYWVQAKKLLIYPQWGYVLLFNGGLHSDYLPFSIPIPTYIYGSKQYGFEGTRSIIPDIGSNKIEGFYVKSAIGYFLSPKTSGMVMAGYADKLGPLIGLTQGHDFSDSQKGSYRIQSSGSDGLEGHVRYDFDFAKRSKNRTDSVLEEVLQNFVEDTSKPLSRMSLILQHKEIIQDVRVSYTPLVTFESNDLSLKRSQYKLTTLANFGKVAEERDDLRRDAFSKDEWTFQSWRSNINSTFSRSDHLRKNLLLNSELHFKGYWYDTGQTWQRLFTTLGLGWNLGWINTQWSYTKLLTPVVGGSPFLFENQYAIESDEIGFGFTKDFSHFDLKGDYFYGLNSHETRILDLTLGLKFHCFRFGFTWKLKQNAFNFGVDIY